MDDEQERSDAQPAEREQPEYRSYVEKGQPKLVSSSLCSFGEWNDAQAQLQDRIQKGDRVRFSLSKTQSPLWTVDDVKFDKALRENVYQLRKNDGTLHPGWVRRDKLTLES